MSAWRIARDDSGVAMVAVIGTLVLVTVVSIAAFSMSQQSLHETGIVRAESQAFQLANAGLDVALANVQVNGFNPAHYEPPMSGTLDDVGEWEVSVERLADSEYLAVATGTDSVTGAQETVRTKFFYLSIWEMNIAAGDNQSLTAGGGGITGTSNVTGPFYVVGRLTMRGGAYIHDGPLFVKGGDIVLDGNSQIGESSKPINVYVTGSYPSKNFYANNVSQAVPTIILPQADAGFLQQKWQLARIESTDNERGTSGAVDGVTILEANAGDPATYTNYDLGDGTFLARSKAPGASAHYKYIGPDSGPSAVGEGSTTLTIGGDTPFGAWRRNGTGAYPAGQDRWDDFAWDPATRTLYVEGTVLVDGDVHFTGPNNTYIRYIGNGTIVANGNITIGTYLAPAGSDNVPATMPLDTDRALGLVTPKVITVTVSANNTDPINPPHIAGALYAGQAIKFEQNVLFKGSVVAGSIGFDHPNVHLVTDPRLPSFLPDGMPGKNMSLLTQGTWAR